jgi:hypothetical protein
MAKNGNITGQVFDEEVINQIETRQNFLGTRYKTDSHLVYGNNSNAFLRLASSISIGTTPTFIEIQVSGSTIQDTATQEKVTNDLLSAGKNQLKERKINENLTGNKLAQSCILFGGTVGVNNSLSPAIKFGVYGDNSGQENDPIGTIAAYGWGGISSKGFVPMPSIISADVSFYNRGALAKASVKIKVYSVEQLQIFDILYFRIGYSMLLEWGHNIWLDSKNSPSPPDPNNPTITPLRERKEFATEPFKLFFKDGTTQQDIIKAIKKQRIDECYNYDAMLGKVTNFTWKFNDDGSYDIDLNLIGLGDIIETLKVNTTNAANLKKDPTPTQVRTKKKSAIDSQKTKIADKKTKAPLAAEAVNKGFEDALVSYNSSKLAQKISQNYSTAFTTAKNTNDTSVPLFENSTLINASILAQFNNLNTNSDLKGLANTAQQAIPEIEAFITEAGPGPEGNAALVAKLTPIIPSLRTLIKSLNNLSILKGNSAKAEDTAKASQAEADAELKALEGALQSVAKEEEIAQLSPETSVESKNKTALNLQLYNWRQEASKGLDKDNLLKLTFVANSSNPTSTGASTLNLNFYYVRLGYLLKWIQENLLYYDPTKKAGDDAGMDNKKLGNPIFTIDFSSEYNFCLRFPSQFSSDPRVCVIPSKYKDENTSWDILTKEIPGYFVNNNDYAGKLMNIFVNIDYIAGCLDKNTDVNGKTNLLKFLTTMLDGVNDVLGNVNKLEPVFDSENNTLKIIEGSSLDNVENLILEAERKNNKMGVFQVYGIGTNDIPKGSFITNVDFQVQLPPNMASMATISAQAGGNVVGENATGLSKLNVGFTDRLMTIKLDKSSIEGAEAGKLDPKALFKTNIQYVGKAVNSLYQSRKFATDTVDNVRSANRDISLYLTGNDAIEGKASSPFFIPFNLSLNMKGLSGMKNYERFSITEEILPYSYRSGDQGGVINFLIKGISHTIGNNEWTTKIESLTVSSNRKVKT